MSKTQNKLEEFCYLPNIASELEGEEDDQGRDLLKQIATEVALDFEDDLQSRQDWEDMIEEGLKLAKLEHEEKDFPWPGASNLKHPITTTAILQFAAYSYPEIVRNDRVAEMAVIGYDYDGRKQDLADRMCRFLNYQLLAEDDEWDNSLDKLLHMLPAQGVVYKKVYWDPIKNKNVSELCGYKEIYVNHHVKDLASARRVSHLMIKHKNELLSKMRAGIFREVDLEVQGASNEHGHRSTEFTEYLEDKEFEIIEQHRWWDLDGDGYEEPYIVTILNETKEVLRIVARFNPEDIKTNNDGEVYEIKPIQHFVDYHYLPSPDGCYHSMSIASLLLAYNKGINAVLNQLINAGTLATTQGGFLAKSARIRGGKIFLEPGEWIKCDSASDVDLKKAIMPLEYKEPSSVLFNLLGFLVDSAKEISSITDVMTGKQNAQNVQATTIQILAEKGLKVFSSIQRRFDRSLARELRAWWDLNKLHVDLEKYKRVLDYMGEVTEEDFLDDSLDVIPVANPNLSSDVQRQSRAQQEMALLELPVMQNAPEAQVAIIKDFLESLNSTNIEQKLPDLTKEAPPDPKTIKVQGDLEDKAGKLDLAKEKHELNRQKFQADYQKQQAEMQKILADVMKTIADAEAVTGNQDLQRYQSQLEAAMAQMEMQGAQEDRAGQQQQNQFDMQMRQMEFEDKKADRAQQAELAKQQVMSSAYEGNANRQHQLKTQQQQFQFDQRSQQSNNQHDLTKHNTKLQADQQKERSKLDHDKYKHDSGIGFEHLAQSEQRDHDRDIATMQKATGNRNPNMAKQPRK